MDRRSIQHRMRLLLKSRCIFRARQRQEYWRTVELKPWLAGLPPYFRVFRNIYYAWCVGLFAYVDYVCGWMQCGNQAHSIFLLELLLASVNPFHLCAISLFQFPFYSVNVVGTFSFWSFCGGGGDGFVFYVQCSCACSLSLALSLFSSPLFRFTRVSFLYNEFIHFPADYWLYLSHFAYMKRPFFLLSFTAYFQFCCASECLCMWWPVYVGVFAVASKCMTWKKKTLFVVHFRSKNALFCICCHFSLTLGEIIAKCDWCVLYFSQNSFKMVSWYQKK